MRPSVPEARARFCSWENRLRLPLILQLGCAESFWPASPRREDGMMERFWRVLDVRTPEHIGKPCPQRRPRAVSKILLHLCTHSLIISFFVSVSSSMGGQSHGWAPCKMRLRRQLLKRNAHCPPSWPSTEDALQAAGFDLLMASFGRPLRKTASKR